MAEAAREFLARYVERHDAEAFRELVVLHQDMVYATCNRVLRNSADAEDAAQSCFLSLARKPEQVRESVTGWLHRAAVHAAVDLARQERSRRNREVLAMERKPASESSSWNEVSVAVDEAIDQLPDDLRIPIIRYYLERRTQEEIARELEVTHSAISKRLERGTDELRARLTKAGISLSVALLGTLLITNAAEAAPATLAAALGKMALAGAGGEAAAGVSAVAGVTTSTGGMLMKIAISGVILTALVSIGIVAHNTMGQKTPEAPASNSARPAPAPAQPAYSLVNKKQLFSADELGWLNTNKVVPWLLVRLSPDGANLLYAHIPLPERDPKTYQLVLRNLANDSDWVLDYLNPMDEGMHDIHIRFNPFDASGQEMALTQLTGDARGSVLVLVHVKERNASGANNLKGRFVIAQFDQTGKKLIGTDDDGWFIAEVDASRNSARKTTRLTFEWHEGLARRYSIGIPSGYPLSVCPTADIICVFGLEPTEGDGRRGGQMQHIVLSDFTGKTLAVLPTNENNNSLDDIPPIWTAHGRYVCYYDLQQEGETRIQGTRIFDRIALEEKAFLKGVAVMGTGPGLSDIVLASLVKKDAYGMVYNVESTESTNITPVGTQVLHAADGKIVYLEPNEAGKMTMQVADITQQ